MMTYPKTSIKSLVKCNFCGQTHLKTKGKFVCPVEKILAPYMKKLIGAYMENYLGKYVSCPYCDTASLQVLGNHTPSLDLICSNCQGRSVNIECKSKCLSVSYLPKDITLPHGNYFDYLQRQEQGLDFIVIIYKVDRVTKVISIRKVIFIPHDEIIKEDNFVVIQNTGSSLSTIFIRDHTRYKDITPLYHNMIDFSPKINKLIAAV